MNMHDDMRFDPSELLEHTPDLSDPTVFECKGDPGYFVLEWKQDEGYVAQLRLIATHLKAGGPLAETPYPSFTYQPPWTYRPLAEGIQRAREHAAEWERRGELDVDALIERFRAKDEKAESVLATHRSVHGGFLTPIEDLQDARLHTTIPKLFTDRVVCDNLGVGYEPQPVARTMLRVDGRVHLLGLVEFDLGVDLRGDFPLDLIDGDSGSSGSGVLVMRLVWGDPESIVGAIEAGEIGCHNRWVGIGAPGASVLGMKEDGRFDGDARLKVIVDEHGMSAWCWSADVGPDGYQIYFLVDQDRAPVGVVVDSTGIANYFVVTDEDDVSTEPWPDDAGEFDPLTDSTKIDMPRIFWPDEPTKDTPDPREVDYYGPDSQRPRTS